MVCDQRLEFGHAELIENNKAFTTSKCSLCSVQRACSKSCQAQIEPDTEVLMRTYDKL